MNRLFSTFFAFLLTVIVISSNAQVKFGIQAGINLSDINTDPLSTVYETSIRSGFITGGIFNYDFTSVLGLQIEPAHIQKGALLDIYTAADRMNIEADATYSINYIDIPVLMKVSSGNQDLMPFLLAGPSIALLVGDVEINLDKVRANGQDVTNQIPNGSKKQKVQFNSLDFALNFGGGVSIPLGRINIILEGLYNLGLTNVNKEQDNIKIKNKGIQLKTGILFSL